MAEFNESVAKTEIRNAMKGYTDRLAQNNAAEAYCLKIGNILARKWYSPAFVIARLDKNSDAFISKDEFKDYFKVSNSWLFELVAICS